MFNKLPASGSENSISLILIPVLLFLANTDILKDKFDLNQDFSQKAAMLKDVKPFFSVKEQYILSKIEDGFDILNKFSRIQKEEYEEEISSTSQSIPKKDRKERILRGMAKYVDDGSKGLIEKVIDINEKIEESKGNYANHKIQNTENQDLTSIIKLASCFRPLFRDSNNKKIRKLDKIIEIINIPEDNF